METASPLLEGSQQRPKKSWIANTNRACPACDKVQHFMRKTCVNCGEDTQFRQEIVQKREASLKKHFENGAKVSAKRSATFAIKKQIMKYMVKLEGTGSACMLMVIGKEPQFRASMLTHNETLKSMFFHTSSTGEEELNAAGKGTILKLKKDYISAKKSSQSTTAVSAAETQVVSTIQSAFTPESPAESYTSSRNGFVDEIIAVEDIFGAEDNLAAEGLPDEVPEAKGAEINVSKLPSESQNRTSPDENVTVTSQSFSQTAPHVDESDMTLSDKNSRNFLPRSLDSQSVPRKRTRVKIPVITSSGTSKANQPSAAIQELETTLPEESSEPASQMPMANLNISGQKPKRPRPSSLFTGQSGNRLQICRPNLDCLFVDQRSHSFAKLCQKFGLIFNTKSRNELRVDQAVFQKRITAHLKEGSDLERSLKDFLNGIKEVLKDEDAFYNAMQPTVMSPGFHVQNTEQDSLVRLLLHIKQFQYRFMSYLFERFVHFVNEPGMLRSLTRRGVDLPGMILSQLSCLDEVEETELFAEKILNILTRVPTWAQSKIITVFQVVVGDES